MPTPTKGGNLGSLSEEYDKFTASTTSLRNWSRDWPNILRNGNSSFQSGIEFEKAAKLCEFIKDHRATLVYAASVNGLPQYAATESNQTLTEVNSSYTATLSALDDVLAWLITNVPKGTANGVKWVESIAADGTVVWTDRRATPAQVEPLAVLLETLNATLEPARVV